MSIIISNISPNAPKTGENEYEIRINERLICTFKHHRTLDGLASCLRDAANAVEKDHTLKMIELVSRMNL